MALHLKQAMDNQQFIQQEGVVKVMEVMEVVHPIQGVSQVEAGEEKILIIQAHQLVALTGQVIITELGCDQIQPELASIARQ